MFDRHHRRKGGKPHPRPGFRLIRRALRLAAVHVRMQFADPHFWNAAAVAAIAALGAIPAEALTSHPMLKIAVPVMLAVGIALRSIERRDEASEKADTPSPS